MKDDGFGVFDRGLDGRSAHDLSLEILREYCKPGKRVLVAFSGGKDSQCIYHLCQEAGVEFTAQYSVTRFEPPELWEFVRRVYPDVRIRRAYRRSLFEDVVRRGPPTRWGRWCCDCKHAKTPGFDLNVVGVRAAESAVRAQMWGAFRRTPDGQSVVCPIFWWSDRMVLAIPGEKGGAALPPLRRGMEEDRVRVLSAVAWANPAALGALPAMGAVLGARDSGVGGADDEAEGVPKGQRGAVRLGQWARRPGGGGGQAVAPVRPARKAGGGGGGGRGDGLHVRGQRVPRRRRGGGGAKLIGGRTGTPTEGRLRGGGSGQ